MYAHGFKRLGLDRILLNNLELWVQYVVTVREFSSHDRNFVYVQTLPEKSTGLYPPHAEWLQDFLQERLNKNYGYYAYEEYALWEDKLITRQEYDDGAALVEGKPVRISGAELRLRYITPYNFILCGGDHILISSEVNVDMELTNLLDEILLGTKNINDLMDFVDNLPNKKRYTV
jgi:hypothetical protein